MKLGEIWIFLTGLIGLIMLFARTGPDDATSNLSKWITWVGIHRIPGWLRSRVADKWALTIGTLLTTTFLLFLGMSIQRWLSQPLAAQTATGSPNGLCWDGPCPSGIPSLPPTQLGSATQELTWEDTLMIERAFFEIPRPCEAKLVPNAAANLQFRNILSAILRVNRACEVIDEQLDQVTPHVDIDAPAAPISGVAVRWRSDFAAGRSLFNQLNQLLHISEGHRMPENSSANLILIQIGDRPWKRH
jgi:hypothetical protein